MKNPFSSDRDIFSKIGRPAANSNFRKSKEEPETTQPIKVNSNQQSIKFQYNTQSNYPSQKQSNYMLRSENPTSQEQKITFGEPRRNQEVNFKIPTKNSNPMVQSEIGKMTGSGSYHTQNKMSFDSSSDFVLSKHEVGEVKRQTMMSPIAEKSRHQMDEDQFINIDAMSSDISKLLASEKNQEQLCKLLGIEKQITHISQFQSQHQTTPQSQIPRMKRQENRQQSYQQNSQQSYHQQNYQRNQPFSQSQVYEPWKNSSVKNEFSKNEPIKKQPVRQYQPYESYHSSQFKTSKFQNQSLKNEEFKNQPVRNDIVRTQPLRKQPFRKQPTRQQPINQPVRNQPLRKIEQSRGQLYDSEKRSEQALPMFGQRYSNDYNPGLEVYEYGKGPQVSKVRKDLDIEKMLEVEMKKLYQNGNTRTFLSGGDRVVTTKYDLQGI